MKRAPLLSLHAVAASGRVVTIARADGRSTLRCCSEGWAGHVARVAQARLRRETVPADRAGVERFLCRLLRQIAAERGRP